VSPRSYSTRTRAEGQAASIEERSYATNKYYLTGELLLTYSLQPRKSRIPTVVCPSCHEPGCRRSHRRGISERVLGWTGLRPWRCENCGERFFAWRAPLRDRFHAHCRLCGSAKVQRVPGGSVRYGHRWTWQKLGVTAYRCARCRNRFFSLFPAAIEGPRKETHSEASSARKQPLQRA
jgi:hypothetical protein